MTDLEAELLAELRDLVPTVAEEHGSDLHALYRSLKSGALVEITFGSRAELETIRTQLRRLIRIDPDIDSRTQFSYVDGVAQFKIKSCAGANKKLSFTIIGVRGNGDSDKDTEL